MELGWISIVPVVLAITLALITKNTVVSLTVACVVGCFLAGKGLWGFTDLLMESLGTPDFIWTALCVLLFGVMVSYFEKSGAITGFSRMVEGKNIKRRGIQLMAWALGLFCFADSMSPLFVGSVMRKLSERAKISSEKLSYIADTTASPVAVLYPFSSWPGYLAGLAVGFGCLATREEAFSFVLKAIPFNFYAILCVAMAGLIAGGILKDFGPMKKAENRAMTEGKIIRDGAEPLSVSEEVEKPLIKERVFLNFILPVLVLIGISIATFLATGEVLIVEAAMIVIILMSISLLAQKMSLSELNKAFVSGIKGSVPALLVLAVAYPLNTLSGEMGTSDFIIESTTGFLTPALLPFGIFLIAAILSFATGTSWGTYAICMPIALPLAFSISGGQVSDFVLLCFAAVAGGGIFGDHCSPLSDTTILASMGSGADHVDHVKTQLFYSLIVAGIAAVMYLLFGFLFV